MKTFEENERRRVDAGLTRKAVYERAGLHKETWRRMAAGSSPTVRTLRKLTSAVDELIAEQGNDHGRP